MILNYSFETWKIGQRLKWVSLTISCESTITSRYKVLLYGDGKIEQQAEGLPCTSPTQV